MSGAGVRLAIDAATDWLSVAADRLGGDTRSERVVEGVRHHAAALPELIEQVLREIGARPAELAAVAVSDGPGGFTGLRVAAAVAKALAVGFSVPLYTAPSLLVRAAGVAEDGASVLAFTNALRGEVYLGVWRFDQPRRVTTLFSPRAVGQPDLVALPAVTRIVGDGPEAISTALERRYGIAPDPAWPRATVLLDLIGVPGREGSGGCTVIEEPALWEPTYGRLAEAQVQWERRHGRPLPDPDSQRR